MNDPKEIFITATMDAIGCAIRPFGRRPGTLLEALVSHAYCCPTAFWTLSYLEGALRFPETAVAIAEEFGASAEVTDLVEASRVLGVYRRCQEKIWRGGKDVPLYPKLVLVPLCPWERCRERKEG
ncbi:MAG: hypothetical protein AB7U30_10790 [Sulfuricellaceae bacterium]